MQKSIWPIISVFPARLYKQNLLVQKNQNLHNIELQEIS